MRFLITGGFGYIGARLAQYLVADGHEVILGTRSQKLKSPDWLPKAKVILNDWSDIRNLSAACDRVDIVIHSAGMNAADCKESPAEAFNFNAVATARLVEAANNSGVNKLIYLSTAHVYSDPLIGLIDEDTCPRNIHPYATSHLAGEHAVLWNSKQNNLEVVVLRLANVIGVPAHKNVNSWTLLVNDLCRQAIEQKSIRLRSSGIQQRDFITMSEVCRTIAFLSQISFQNIGNPIYNLGSGEAKSVYEIAELIQTRCNIIFNFTPKLETVNDHREVINIVELIYSIKKITSLGISINSSPQLEIDQLLHFCYKEYNEFHK